LITTVTASPSRRLSRSTLLCVIAATISWPLTSTTTSAMIVTSFTLFTVPASWLRALSSFALSLTGVLRPGIVNARVMIAPVWA
jgi:hypothetical protein